MEKPGFHQPYWGYFPTMTNTDGGQDSTEQKWQASFHGIFSRILMALQAVDSGRFFGKKVETSPFFVL
jgi:hypothetical protein